MRWRRGIERPFASVVRISSWTNVFSNRALSLGRSFSGQTSCRETSSRARLGLLSSRSLGHVLLTFVQFDIDAVRVFHKNVPSGWGELDHLAFGRQHPNPGGA